MIEARHPAAVTHPAIANGVSVIAMVDSRVISIAVRTMTSEAWACLATLASASAVTLVGGDLDGFA